MKTKLTKATVKSFIKKNAEQLHINLKSRFDGMTDCVESVNGGFEKAKTTQEHIEYTLGIAGAWFVGSSRDYFSQYEDSTMTGIIVSNSCGSFILAVQK
jgi:hypothetical protein